MHVKLFGCKIFTFFIDTFSIWRNSDLYNTQLPLLPARDSFVIFAISPYTFRSSLRLCATSYFYFCFPIKIF